jgi:hypothetical protein
MLNRLTLLASLLASITLLTSAHADEGMWTFDNFPSDRVMDRYGVDIGQEWLDKAQLATTRLENGCTGSLASEDGLVLTNNHCVWGCVRNLSSAERNLSEEGFHARDRSEELQCPGQQISVLVGFTDVTKTVNEATSGLSDTEANAARKARLTDLESACEDKTDGKLNCEAVTLYNGGQYFIYQYKRYSDVRLVFAPELSVAAFGGDPDNFQFPRWSLDFSFLRAYENDEPASTPVFLKWRKTGPRENEPVFITGHPGSTDRKLTMSQLRMLRDEVYFSWIQRYSELRGRMIAWANTSDEAKRIVGERLLGYENGIKVYRNRLRALNNEEMMAIKAQQEEKFRAAVKNDAELNEKYGDAWELIDSAIAAHRNLYQDHLYIENGAGLNSDLYNYARTIVRGTAERELPNNERIRSFTDAALPQVEQRLLAERPIYPEFEKLKFAFSMDKMREWLGPDSPQVKEILGGETPETVAARMIDGTRLADAAYRKKLWEGGVEAVQASDDPMIQLALAVDPEARALRKRYEDEVEAPRTRGEEKIADAYFKVYGTDSYPDATFTLRATFGSVVGWKEKGEDVQPFTQTKRLFERATGNPPFKLPESWVKAKPDLNPQTPFNFVATLDITGGNSGSPIISADGDLVGLAFDGNIHSIAGSYWFDPALNRAGGVNTAIMLEALDAVYGADKLLEELTIAE